MGNTSTLREIDRGRFQTNLPKALPSAIGMSKGDVLVWQREQSGALVRKLSRGEELAQGERSSTLQQLKHGQYVTIVPKPLIADLEWKDGLVLEWTFHKGGLLARKKDMNSISEMERVSK